MSKIAFVNNLRKSWQEGTGLRVATVRLGGELSSMAGVVFFDGLAHGRLKEPYDAFINKMSVNYVEPNLEWFEGHLQGLGSIDSDQDKENRKDMSREERAKYVTKQLDNILGAKMWGGLAGQMIGGGYFSHKVFACNSAFDLRLNKFPVRNLQVNGVDRGVSLATVMFLNKVTPGFANDMQKWTSNFLGSLGMEEDRARDVASYMVNWKIADFAGASTSAYAHYKIGSAAMGK